MKRFVMAIALAACPLLAGGCADKAPAPAKAAATAAAATSAPDSFRVTFETSQGTFVVAITRAWAPRGADRFYELVEAGFFDNDRFFRVVPHFVAQFGLNDNPKTNEQWDTRRLVDDSVTQSNTRGTIVFASEGRHTRNHQLFINLTDNVRLDAMGFAPIGRVVQGMDVVDSLYGGYGDQPDQQFIQTLGNSYLTRMFPKLDYIRAAKIEPAP